MACVLLLDVTYCFVKVKETQTGRINLFESNPDNLQSCLNRQLQLLFREI